MKKLFRKWKNRITGSLVTFNTGNFSISKYWSFYIRSFEILIPTQTIWDFHLQFHFQRYKLSKNAQKNRNFQNFKLVVPLNKTKKWIRWLNRSIIKKIKKNSSTWCRAVTASLDNNYKKINKIYFLTCENQWGYPNCMIYETDYFSLRKKTYG